MIVGLGCIYAWLAPDSLQFVAVMLAMSRSSLSFLHNRPHTPRPLTCRYGHPTDRPHYASGLPPAAFEAVVCSYLRHGLAGTEPKVGGWIWEELQVGRAT